MKQHFMMFAAYNQWANGRIYDAAAELDDEEFNRHTGAFFGSMMGTLNHLLTTDRIWMKRFTGEGDAPTTLDAIFTGLCPCCVARARSRTGGSSTGSGRSATRRFRVASPT